MKDDPKIWQAAKNAFDLSVAISNVEVTNARMELATKAMVADMKSDWGNVAIVMNQYAFQCKELLENPDDRLQYWLDKS